MNETKPKQITFCIHRLPISLNKLFHMHWKKRSEFQHIYDHLIYTEWLRLDRYVFLNPVKLTYVLSFASKRQRDLDNYIGGTKLLTDALKRTFLCRDDAEWIVSIEVKFIRGDENTVVIIEEAFA